LPVIVVSAVTMEGSKRALEALAAGAVTVVGKPQARDGEGFETMLAELTDAVIEASRIKIRRVRVAGTGKHPPIAKSGASADRLVVIGASTGGTVALGSIIPLLPADMPPVLVVQHMPPVFTRLFAEALDKASQLRVKEAEQGEELISGRLLVAAGDWHLRVVRDGGRLRAELDKSEKVSGHRPSVDVLFSSAALACGARTVALILTGMGRDGANGLLSIRRAGGRCLAQDEETSVVFGMPKEAWEIGAAERLVPIEKAADAIMECLREPVAEGTWRR
jgi:two-component system chemotaxis response regulator CheB